MPNIFNAITTGVGGIATTADSSGSFAFAKDGSTVATISGTGVITASAISGLSTALTVAQGGTGATSLAANNVLLGNNTSAVQAVAPGTSGNVLTSNGTTWTSAAAPAPNTTNVLAAMAGMTAGVVGSLTFGYSGTGAFAINTNVAGNTILNQNGTNMGFTGTWKSMSSGNAGGYNALWIRIS